MKSNLNFFKQYGWLLIAAGFLISALWLMSFIIKQASNLVEYYIYLLIFSLVGIAILVSILGRTIYKLYQQYKTDKFGAKSITKVATTLTLILILPIAILYYFSLSFIHHEIDQWFNISAEQAIKDSSKLVRQQLDLTTRSHLGVTQRAVDQFELELLRQPASTVGKLRSFLGAQDVSLYDKNQLLIAYSNQLGPQVLPSQPPTDNLFQLVKLNHYYAKVEYFEDLQQDIVRILLPLDNPTNNQKLTLQIIYSLPETITEATQSVRIAEAEFYKTNYLHQPIKNSFTLVLTMVFVLTLTTTLLLIIQTAQNLTRPIHELVRGTQRVAQGDYSTLMISDSKDEFRLLINSFNDMIQQVARARNDIKINHQQTEVQRLYFQTVIRNLSSGVLTLDMNRRLRTINQSAGKILGIDLQTYVSEKFCDISKLESRDLAPFFSLVENKFNQPASNQTSPWTQQISLQLNQQQQILLIHGSTLPSIDQKIGGFVIVIDDITELIQAQRHAAWSDMARRLAHEIKNPLTPIQLSAERLYNKLARQLDPENTDFVKRMTDTIVAQVSNMQDLVQAFIDYAHTPDIILRPTDINQEILMTMNLYQEQMDDLKLIELELDPACPPILADSSRLRQVFHNLIKNSLEALESIAEPKIVIKTDCKTHDDKLLIVFRDNGPGISEQAINWVFEPYATDKPTGSGLGLSIVKKIIEEHHGQIELSKSDQTGTEFTIYLSKNSSQTSS